MYREFSEYNATMQLPPRHTFIYIYTYIYIYIYIYIHIYVYISLAPRLDQFAVPPYRGTSLIRKRPLL